MKKITHFSLIGSFAILAFYGCARSSDAPSVSSTMLNNNNSGEQVAEKPGEPMVMRQFRGCKAHQ
jgi:hypothetical protein